MQKSLAPAMYRTQPDTLIRSLLILIAYSAVLLSDRPAGHKRPQIVADLVLHPVRLGMPIVLERAAADGVEHDPGLRGGGEVSGPPQLAAPGRCGIQVNDNCGPYCT